MARQLIVALCLTAFLMAAPVWAHGAAPVVPTVDLSLIQNLNAQLLAGKATNSWWGWFTKGNDKTDLKNIAIERQTLMLRLTRENPAGFLQLVIQPDVKKTLPAEVQPYIEESFVGQGTLEVLHEDDFENANSFSWSFLQQGSSKWNLYTTKSLGLISGAKLNVSGFRLAQSVVAETREVEVLSGGRPQAVIGPVRLLVIPIEFPDSPARPVTTDEINQRVFSGPFQNFYQEQSYGRLSFVGEVTDWIRVERRDVSGSCRAVGLYDAEIFDYITSHNIDLRDYYGVVFLVNLNPDISDDEALPGCGSVGRWSHYLNEFGGWSSILLSNAWLRFSYGFGVNYNWPFAWSAFDALLAHEIGHNLGIYNAGDAHADGLDCGQATITGDCNHVEYGNRYDVMGYASLATHFNAFYKEVLGWIRPAESLVIRQSGEYTIGPLETNNSAPRLAKIQVGDSFPFYLEYRRSIGFDANLGRANIASNQNGLIINRILDRSTPELLSMRPTSTEWNINVLTVSLNGGSIFVDPTTGVSIGPILSHSANSITFGVTIPENNILQWWQVY